MNHCKLRCAQTLKLSLLVFFGCYGFLAAQVPLDDILQNYEANGLTPREVVYLHLNKNIFLEGEQLAFKAYLWDRTNDRPANVSKNLYVRLTSRKGDILDEQMLYLENGLSHGLFEIDSTMVPYGDLQIEAFTNYMRNFEETNHFEEQITILNTEGQRLDDSPKSGPVLEVFPEGGGLALNKENKVRIQLTGIGSSSPNQNTVQIKDGHGTLLQTVLLDSLGGGQFLIIPKTNKRYTAQYGQNHTRTLFEYPKKKSHTITLKNLGEKLAVTAYSNLKNKEDLQLAIHNGKSIKAVTVAFDKHGESLNIIPKTDLFDGMNLFTLFDKEGKALSERYFYNIPQKIKEIQPLDFSAVKKGDSVLLTVRNIGDPKKFNSLSATVLPIKTKSYDRNHNLLSYSELVPFTSGATLMPKRFFLNRDAKSFYGLNNALIGIDNTKRWNTFTTSLPRVSHLPEDGVTLYGTVNRGGRNFIASGTLFGEARSGIVEEGTNTFTIENLYPLSSEKLVLREVNKKGRFEKPGLFLRFEPMVIPKHRFPNLKYGKPVLPKQNEEEEEEEDSQYVNYELFQKVTILDEVEVIANREEKRRDSIRNRTYGRVDFFEMDDYRRNMFLSVYLNQFGFNFVETMDGQVSIVNRSPNSPTNPVPAVFLDDMILYDFSILFRFRLDMVDYIEIDRSGVTGLWRSGGGIIKIYTDPFKFGKLKQKEFDFGYPVPLGFEPPKTYRVPDYLSFDGKMFKDYGVIAWEPWLGVAEDNSVTMTFFNPGYTDFKVALEGILNGNDLISHEIDVRFSDIKEVLSN